MTLSGGPSASRDGVTSVEADFDAVDEIKADGAARKGKHADAGLAVENHRVSRRWQSKQLAESVPRRIKALANLVLENMMFMSNGRCPAGER